MIFPLEVNMVETEVASSVDSSGTTIRMFVCLMKISTCSSMIFLVLLNSLQYCEADAFRRDDFVVVLFFGTFVLVKLHHLLFGLMLC